MKIKQSRSVPCGPKIILYVIYQSVPITNLSCHFGPKILHKFRSKIILSYQFNHYRVYRFSAGPICRVIPIIPFVIYVAANRSVRFRS